MILGKYNQSKTVKFSLVAPDGVDLIINATFAAGDIKISKDEGAEANTTNLPTDEGTGYSLVLTATEMSAARISLYIIDQTATKVWLDIPIEIETYGNASAEHAFDLDTASTAQTGDSYPIVNNGTYGNSALNTDLDTLLARIIGTLAAGTHNAQSGDSFLRIGVAGAGLTNINLPNQTMDIIGNITGNLSGSVGSVTAINTTGGAIDNVTLVATTTTNTDMRGTDGANTTAPDNASIAAILIDTGTALPATLATLATAANLATADGKIDTIDAIVDAILVDTGTDIPALLTILDTVADAIKAKTDSLTFTKANELDSNTQSINDVTLTGDGSITPFNV